MIDHFHKKCVHCLLSGVFRILIYAIYKILYNVKFFQNYVNYFPILLENFPNTTWNFPHNYVKFSPKLREIFSNTTWNFKLVMHYSSIGMLNTPKTLRSNATLMFRSPDIHTTQAVAEYAIVSALPFYLFSCTIFFYSADLSAGWILDTMDIVQGIDTHTFTL